MAQLFLIAISILFPWLQVVPMQGFPMPPLILIQVVGYFLNLCTAYNSDARAYLANTLNGEKAFEEIKLA